MPITTSFTLTAALALVALVLILREFRLNRNALMARGMNGLGLEVATMLVRLIWAIAISDALLLIAGVGILTGERVAGYGLALIPAVYAVACLQIFQSLRRQRNLVGKH